MAYTIKVDPTMWSSAYLNGKDVQTFRSSIKIGLRGANTWVANQQLTIDATPISMATKTFTLLDYRKQERSPSYAVNITTDGTPSIALPFVQLNTAWITNKPLSVTSRVLGNSAENPLVEGVDWVKNTTTSRIMVINPSLIGSPMSVSYWRTQTAFTYSEDLPRTTEALAWAINNSNSLGVLALPLFGSQTDIVLESLMIGENADLIEISRANVAAAEILLNDADVNGPITLSGNASNQAAIAMVVKFNRNGEFYIEGVPGEFVTTMHPKVLTDEDFTSFGQQVIADLAVYVAKGLLKVFTAGAALTASQVLEKGYLTTHAVP